MRRVWKRSPEMIFVATLVIFMMMLVVRSFGTHPTESLAYDTHAPVTKPRELSTQQMITDFQERIRRKPNDAAAYAGLGLAYLQRVRETADPALYGKAEQAFTAALQHDPQQLDAVLGQGSLALSRHQFAEALRLGERARTLNPYRSQVYGVMGDALVELGRYDEAVTTMQKMVDTRPDISSYSRVSYQRELHGEVDAAITAMKQAVAAGNPTSEQTLWSQVQLGHLFFNKGDWAQADATYRAALHNKPDYVYAFAGTARVLAAEGHYPEAIKEYKQVVQILPLPEFVIALGELYEVTGQQAEAAQQYGLVRAIEQLSISAGVDVDMELAVFDADHGADPTETVAKARASYARRPSIYGADALAWALYHAAQYTEAQHYSAEALRLGTRDAALHYHAGMIAYALGDHATARQQLEQAQAINPVFSIRYAGEMRKLLATH